jgi:peptide/nickel transport system permease protein
MHLARLVTKRLAAAIPLLFLVSLAIFSITYLVPGDPAATIAGDNATRADVARIHHQLGLDRPFIVQYGNWIRHAVTGNLGRSIIDGRAVTSIIKERMPAALSLAFGGMLIALLIGIPLGIAAAVKIGSVRDRLCVMVASIGVAVPSYWLGIVLVTYLSVRLGWFPATGFTSFTADPIEWLRHLALPAFALGLAAAAELARQTRASLSETLERDYVRTARMKGLPARRVVGKHALKNAAIPVVTAFGLQLTIVLGGSVIVERVFGIPALGDLALSSVTARDLPVIQGIALLTTLIAIGTTLAIDLVTIYLNPRVAIS